MFCSAPGQTQRLTGEQLTAKVVYCIFGRRLHNAGPLSPRLFPVNGDC